MKKFAMLLAVLALMVALAFPAFADTAIGGDVDVVDADQVQAAATVQVNAANDQDLAGAAQSLSVEQNQVLAAQDSIAAGQDAWIGW